MPDPVVIHSANIALRAGLFALLMLLAAVLLRDHGRSSAARLGAACAAGAAAYALMLVPGFASPPQAWQAPLVALSTGNALVFWLLSRALFDDGFVLRIWHGVAWGVLAGAGLISCYGLASDQPAGQALGAVILLVTLGCSVLAVAQSLATWRADLVEGRRRLRIFIVAAGAGYTVLNTGTKVWLHQAPAVELASLIDAIGLAAVIAPIVWRLLGSTGSALFVPPAAPTSTAPAAEPVPAAPDPAELRLIAALERLMVVEQVYREDGLTIGALADRLGVPEHRLRRAINQGLGHRNFNQYLNGYRLADAKAALADPSRAAVPVLTIAMDAGFQSLGPFNRAFKADTGLTPSEYRRLGGLPASAGERPLRLADSETA